MRPEILNPLFAEVEALPGVGPQVAKSLKRLDITRAVDLAFHLPTGTIERVQAPAGQRRLARSDRVLELTPFEIRQPRAGGRRCEFSPSDAAGNTITLGLFQQSRLGEEATADRREAVVSGRLDAYGDEWQIVHPEVLDAGKAADLPLREPVYPLTEGIANRRMRELALAALERAPELAEWIEPSLLAAPGLARLARRARRSAFRSARRCSRATVWRTTRFSPTNCA